MNKLSAFWLSVIILGGALLIGNFIIPEKKFANDEERYDSFMRNDLPYPAAELAAQYASRDSQDLEWNVRYVRAHYDIPKRRKVGKHTEIRDDTQIQAFYNAMAESADTVTSDIGLYCWGLAFSIEDNYADALGYYQRVRNRNLKYLNNSVGFCVLYRGGADADSAEGYFRREIALNGNIDGAYSNLFDLLVKQKRYDELKAYLNNKNTSIYFSHGQKRALYFHYWQIGNYFNEVLNRFRDSANTLGVIAALLVLICWSVYLYKIDLFEKERWGLILLTILLGAAFSFLVEPLSDYLNIMHGFNLNGGILNDLLYCIIGIGAIEEWVKIVPLLLILVFARHHINEPFDYILYASLSALGFAFAENILYFYPDGLRSIFGRAISAAVLHMFCSSVIAYGLILNSYVRRKNPVSDFLLFFGIAAAYHGLYDFWLINKSVSVFGIFSTLMLLIALGAWGAMKQNALNNSSFFTLAIQHNEEAIRRYLMVSLACILVFEYFAVGFTSGLREGNRSVGYSLFTGGYILFFISGLVDFTISKNIWAAIPVWKDFKLGKETKQNLKAGAIVGRKVILEAVSANKYLKKHLPNDATLTDYVKLEGMDGTYIARLANPMDIPGYENDIILIKPGSIFMLLEGYTTSAGAYLIKDVAKPIRAKYKGEDLLFAKYVRVRLINGSNE